MVLGDGDKRGAFWQALWQSPCNRENLKYQFYEVLKTDHKDGNIDAELWPCAICPCESGLEIAPVLDESS